MGGGENKAANPTSSDDQLAKDVARLYAWANVEGVPYRDFSRQRKIQQKPVTSAVEEQDGRGDFDSRRRGIRSNCDCSYQRAGSGAVTRN